MGLLKPKSKKKPEFTKVDGKKIKVSKTLKTATFYERNQGKKRA